MLQIKSIFTVVPATPTAWPALTPPAPFAASNTGRPFNSAARAQWTGKASGLTFPAAKLASLGGDQQ
jgi:hypothetical protein